MTRSWWCSWAQRSWFCLALSTALGVGAGCSSDDGYLGPSVRLSGSFNGWVRGEIAPELTWDGHEYRGVVTLPGETVEAQNGQILIDGEPLDEPYLDEGVTTGDFDPVTVPEGHYFMMGDNRGDSRDSRFFGPIAEETIVGRAFFRVWPLGDISTL